ncbi:MAG: 1-acyl-sn-glycerol-3-phosphate acyltransferase [Tyzzerella sp.]|nr:1-acyl-sn-glycerol-3-phosphate acyltransferase [Tyzzerella sp.]
MKHQIIWSILRPLVYPYLKIKFGYTYEKAKNLPETYIVLSNHTTDYDPIFVSMSFSKFMHYIASEHVARWNFLSTLINFAFAPIWRYKGSIAASTVIDVFKKVKDKKNVALFAEGARTWDGVTGPILPSTGKMVKKAGCGLVTYKIVGGYFASPRWSQSNTRKGYVHGAPVNIYTKEQLQEMTVDEINEAINRDLCENAYERQLQEPKKYTGKDLAKYMENLLFICPKCGNIDTIQTSDNKVTCSACDLSFTYNEYGMLEGSRFKTVKEISDWQRLEVANIAKTDVVYTASGGRMITVKKHVETLVAEGPVTLSRASLICGDREIPLSEISDMSIHGRRGLVFTAQKHYYELVPSKEANALKFLWLYEEYAKQNADI